MTRGILQQSRFLALVSNGERLAELSEKAANSQDAATLQVLKTMDSIEAKSQQLKTSLQSLYTSTGVQNLFKGILDYGNNIIITFTKMPTVFNLPIVAIAKFGTQFFTLANVVTNAFGLIKARLTSQSKILQGQMTADAKMGEIARLNISQEEREQLIAILNQKEVDYQQFENKLTEIKARGVKERTNLETKGGVSKSMARGGLIASAAGSALSMISAGMGDNTQGQRTAKGLTDIFGTALSGVGTGLMISGPAGAIVGALTALPGLITGISTMYESAAERAERLKKAVEETNNVYLQRKDEAKTLQEQIDKLEELEKAQYDSVEAKQEFIELSNQIAETNPELVNGYDLEGNAIIDLTSSYWKLTEAREAALKAAKDSANASFDQYSNSITQAKENKKNAVKRLAGTVAGDYASVAQDDFIEQFAGKYGLNKEEKIKFSDVLKKSFTSEDFWGLDNISILGTDLSEKIRFSTKDIQDYFEERYNIQNSPDISNLTDLTGIKNNTQVSDIIKQTEEYFTNGNIDQGLNLVSNNLEELQQAQKELKNSDDKAQQETAKYLQAWIERINEIQKLQSDVVKSENAEIINFKNQIAQYTSISLMGDDSEYLKDLQNANQFLTQFLLEKQKKSEKDYETYYNEDLKFDFDEAQKALEEIWKNLGSSFNINKFNQLIKDSKNYSSEQMYNELQQLGIEKEEDIFTLLYSIYGEDLTTSVINFENAIKKRLENNKGNNQLNKVLESFNSLELGEIDTSAILDKYDQLQRMVDSGAITDNYAATLLNNYRAILDISKTIEDSTKREQVQSALADLDLTSLESVDNFINLLTELGLIAQFKGVEKLKSDIPINLNTEINNYVETITSEMEGFESALSKATKGMNYKDAKEIAQKMQVSVASFRQVGDKFFIDDLDALEKAYFSVSKDLVVNLKGKITDLKTNLEGIGELSDESLKEQGPEEIHDYLEEIKENLSDTLRENGINVNLDSLNLEAKYNDWIKVADETGQTFIDYLIEQLEIDLEEAEKLEKVTKAQKAQNYLEQGKFDKFLENVNLNEQDKGLAEKYYKERNFEGLSNIIPQYIQTVIDSVNKANKDILNRLTSESSTDNWVEQTDLNTDLLRKLYKQGFLVDSKWDEENKKYWWKLGEVNSENIKEYFNILDSAIESDSERASERAKATTQVYNQSLDKYLQDAYKNTENVSADVAEHLRALLNLSDDDFNKIFKDNEKGGYKLDLTALIEAAIKSDKEISQATIDAGVEAIEKTTDTILKEISNATDLMSKGTTSNEAAQKFVDDYNELMRKIGGEEIDVDTAFDYNDLLQNLTLNPEIIQNYMNAQKALLQKNNAWNEDTEKLFIAQTQQLLASMVDIQAFLNAENNGEGSEARETLEAQMRNYYATLGITGDAAEVAISDWIKLILEGGIGSARAISIWAERAGKEASSKDTETGYLAEITKLENAFDQLSYNVGSVVNEKAHEILKEAGYTFTKLEDGSYRIDTIGNVNQAYQEYYNQLARTDEATVAALNEAKTKILETEDDTTAVIAALGDAANMTITSLYTLFSDKGKELTDEVYKGWIDSGAIEDLGNGKLRVNNIKEILDELGYQYDEKSEEYISAFKTYNDSLIGMNRKAERNILEEVSKLNEAKAGDWINLTQLYSKLQEAIVPDWYNGNVNLEKRPRVSAEDLIDKGWYAEIGEKGTINGATYSWNEIKGMPEKMMVSLASITEDGLVKSYDEVKDYLQERVNEAEKDGQVDIDELKQLDEENQNLLLDIFISESNDINEAIAEANERAGDLHDRQALFEDFLNEELLEYGAQLENGVLQISDEGANIPMIMQILSDKIQKYGNLSAQEEAELLDTLNANLKSYSDAISNAIKGTASNVEMQKLEDWAESLDIKIDFRKTTEGLKLSKDSAISLYNHLKEIDSLQSRLVFKELSDSLKENNGHYKSISSILAHIKTLQKEIDNLPVNSARKKEYEQELALAKEIRQTRSLTDPESFDFMGQSLPDAFKGAENYWNSWGSAFKAMNEAGETGRMSMTDFYNIVQEMQNLAVLSGQDLTFMGRTLSKTGIGAAELIEEGFRALTNVDGEGVEVNLKKLGNSYVKGALGMQDGVRGGIKVLAQSQIDMLDAQIQLLETIVAMEKLGQIDVNGNGIFDLIKEELGEVDDDGFIKEFGEGYKRAIVDLKKYFEDPNASEDVKNAYKNVKIMGHSIEELFNASEEDLRKWGIKGETLQKLLQGLYELSQSDDFDPSNVTQMIQQMLVEQGLDGEISVETGKHDIIINDKGQYHFDWSSENLQAALSQYGEDTKENRKKIEDAIKNYDKNQSQNELEVRTALIAKDIIDIDKETGEFEINGKKYKSDDVNLPQVIAEAVLKDKIPDVENIHLNEEGKFSGTYHVGNRELTVTYSEGKVLYHSDVLNKDFNSQDELLKAEYDNYVTHAQINGIELPTYEQWLYQKYSITTNTETTFKDSEGNEIKDPANNRDFKNAIQDFISKSETAINVYLNDPNNLTPNKDGTYTLTLINGDKITFAAENEEEAKAKAKEEAVKFADPLVDSIANGIKAAFTNDPDNSIGKAIGTGIVTALTDPELLADKQFTIPEVKATITKLTITEALDVAFGNAGGFGGFVKGALKNLTGSEDLVIPEATAKVDKLTLTDADEVDATTVGEKIATEIENYFKENPIVINAELGSVGGTNPSSNSNSNSDSNNSPSTSIFDEINNKIKNIGEASNSITADKVKAIQEEQNKIDSNKVAAIQNAQEAIRNDKVMAIEQAQAQIRSDRVEAIKDAAALVDASHVRAIKTEADHISTDKIEAVKRALDNIGGTASFDVNISVNVSGGSNAKGTIGSWSVSRGGGRRSNGDKTLNWSQSYAYAKGKDTLMGELGPELVVSNGRYFLVGQNGPEMVNLAEDAIVFNHLQTQKLIEKGKVNTHGKPITNERNAVSMATGNFSGPAMASAQETLDLLKQLRAMWESLLNASYKDLGIMAGLDKDKDKDKKDKDPDSSKEESKYVAGIVSEVERWYNWLRAIEATQREINKLTKEYTILENEGVSSQEKIANLREQYAKREENKAIREDLIERQTKYREELAKSIKDGNNALSAFYQIAENGELMLAKDSAFQEFVKSQGGTFNFSTQKQHALTEQEANKLNRANEDWNEKHKNDRDFKARKTDYKTGEIFQGNLDYDQAEALGRSFINGFYDYQEISVKSGAELMEELQKQDDYGNLVYSAEQQFDILKQLGLDKFALTRADGSKIDTTKEGWQKEAMENFYSQVDGAKDKWDSLTNSINEQQQAALDDAIAMQEINKKIREAAKAAPAVTKQLDKWYNETKKIQQLQQEINKLVLQLTNLQKDRIINGKKIYQNYKDSEISIKNQIIANNELIEKRRQAADELAKKYAGLPIDINPETGVATFSEEKVKKTVETSYTRVKTNDQGYEVDVNGQYRDSNGVLRDKNGKEVKNGNFGELATETITNTRTVSGTLPEILEKLTARDANGKQIYETEEIYQILKNLGYEEWIKYDENGNQIYDNFGALTGEEMKNAVEAGITRLQNSANEINNNNDEIVKLEEENLKLESDANAIIQAYVDNQLEVEDMVKEAVKQQHQDAIDTRKDFRDSLEDANTNLIEGLRDSLDREKQIYETNENKEELKSLQRQLAVAQQSGKSLSKIQDLQKQVADKQQDLYFQERENSIDELEDSAKKQVEALEEQIKIMETSLKYQIDNGLIWQEVNELIASSTPSELVAYITDHNPEFRASSGLGQEQTLLSIGDKIDLFYARQQDPDKTDIGISNEDNDAGSNVGPLLDADSLFDDLDLNFDISSFMEDLELEIPDIDLVFEPSYKEPEEPEIPEEPKQSSGGNKEVEVELPEGFKIETIDLVEPRIDLGNPQLISGGLIFDDKKPKKKKKYAKGGDIDYTGLAWVDGSENKPEHIFNFEQMETLRAHLLNNVDVTRQAVNGLANIVNNLPNINTYNTINNETDSGIVINTLDFHMEVKEMNNDYDARRAGQEVINEIVHIARKSGTRSLSRR